MDRKRQWFEDEERGENIEEKKKTQKGDALTHENAWRVKSSGKRTTQRSDAD